MRIHPSRTFARQRGQALLLVMAFAVISMIILAGALNWTSTNARLTSRNNEYWKAAAAAEAASEKLLSRIIHDFRNGDESDVVNNLSNYRSAIPTIGEYAGWEGWTFTDPATGTNGVYVVRDTVGARQYVELNSQYAGLIGLASTYSIIANARPASAPGRNPVSAGVRQQFQLATIPIFQFAIFYGVPMEIHPGQAFNVTGRVHSNDAIYYSSGAGLHFRSHVTSVGELINGVMPGDPNSSRGNNFTFHGEADEKTSHLSLPIGTNNTPEAVRQILEPPPFGESHTSAMGKERYYNRAEMIITVENGGITVTSGRQDNFATTVPEEEWQLFIDTSNAFKDWREEKTVLPVDIDVAALGNWSGTNSNIKSSLGGLEVSAIYVDDKRTTAASELPAVRVRNGRELPARGLTVSTSRPLYVQGHFNQPDNAHLGTTNTTATKPASFAADAVTVLSENWDDGDSWGGSLGSRVAHNTTVNAAFLAGIVPTAEPNETKRYSGGVENYPRFLEKWSGKSFRYNGSMVVLFHSEHATGGWKYGGSIYEAPARDWAFDLNFMDPTKLPPGTPMLTALVRGQWDMVGAGSTNTLALTP